MAGSTHNPKYLALLQVLRDARKRQRVSQIVLAERLGNTQTFVSKCERGERRIDLVEFVEFVEALGLLPQDVLGEYLQKLSATGALTRKTSKRQSRAR